jgi:HSP20 family protein
VYRERFVGTFKRSFSLPDDIDAEKIQAKYEDGVLNIDVPKTISSDPRKISID